MKFNITIIEQDFTVDTSPYWETAQLIHYSLIDLGYESIINFNCFNSSCKNIIFGLTRVELDILLNLPPDTIFFNTEPIYDENIPQYKKDHLLKIINQFEVWDYSNINVNYLSELGFSNAKLFKFGYQPQLNRISKPDLQDIDVLFYGSLNHRRMSIINELRSRGLKVETIAGLYGQERDLYIARSKLIINIYLYNVKTFDIVRCFYLMSNSKAVITEADDEFPIPSEYKNGICAVAYSNIVETCVKYVNDNALRLDLERNALKTMQLIPQNVYTRTLIN